jgi:hypothetical protein
MVGIERLGGRTQRAQTRDRQEMAQIIPMMVAPTTRQFGVLCNFAQ